MRHMTRSMLVMLALAAGMFAVAPWIINAAPYESTMGLVQKIFYFHMPSAWLFLTAAIICRRRQLPLPVPEAAARRPLGASPPRSWRCCSAPSRS